MEFERGSLKVIENKKDHNNLVMENEDFFTNIQKPKIASND